MTQHILFRTLLAALFIIVMMVSCQKDANDPKQEPPTISSYLPATGFTGTAISINGKNFGTTVAGVQVTFYDGATAVVNSVTDTSIKVTIPAGAYVGKVKVKVKALEAVGPEFSVMKTCNVGPPIGIISCPRIKP